MKFLTTIVMLTSLNTFAVSPSLKESVEALEYELATGEPIEKAKVQAVLKVLSSQLSLLDWICDDDFKFSSVQESFRLLYASVKNDSKDITVDLGKLDAKKSILIVKRETKSYTESYQFETNSTVTELTGLKVTYELESQVRDFTFRKFPKTKTITRYSCGERKEE